MLTAKIPIFAPISSKVSPSGQDASEMKHDRRLIAEQAAGLCESRRPETMFANRMNDVLSSQEGHPFFTIPGDKLRQKSANQRQF
jgi:hypothetical protein